MKKWTFWHSAGLFLSVALIILAGFLIAPRSGVWAWIVICLSLVASAAIIGHGSTNLWKGVLIDEDKRVSLSRLQMLGWTIMVLSTFITIAFLNIKHCRGDPLAIKIPEGLWILMGISTTSLVGAPLVSSTKKARHVSSEELTNVKTKIAGKETIGYIVVNKDMKDATMAEVFRGEELSNFEKLDLSKIQMFYFTVITLVAYFVAVIGLLSTAPGCIDSLPPLSDSMVALLGISHAGFLTSQAVPRPVTDKK